MENKNRIVFLDYLRVAACFMVMVIHACEPYYLNSEGTYVANRTDLVCVTVVECLCRVCVPLFVMASSYLLFPLKVSSADFFRRRIFRIVLPFMLWSCAFLWFCKGNWGAAAFNFPLDAAGHLWFVPMLLGLYILMPLFSPWAQNVGRRELSGWIGLWLFTTTFPFLRAIVLAVFGEPVFGAVPYLWGECPWNAFGAFHYISGFVGYMLVGLWFRKFASEFSIAKTLKLYFPSYMAGIALLGLPFYSKITEFPFTASYAFAVRWETSIEYCSLGVALASISVFAFFSKIKADGKFYKMIIRPISEASFGAYLLHMFVLTQVCTYLKVLHMPTACSIIVSALISFVLSMLIAIGIRKIPFIGKLICG